MKNQSKIVFVNPVPRIPTQGRDKQSYTIIDPKTGEMKTGPNMFKTMESGVAKEIGFIKEFTQQNAEKMSLTDR